MPESGKNAPSRPLPSSLAPSLPAADVGGAPVAMVTNRGPVPPPPPCPGPLTSAHVSGGALLAGPSRAGGTERRSEPSGVAGAQQRSWPASPRSSPPSLAAGPSMVMADGPKHLQRGPVRVGFYDIEGTLGKGNFAVVKLGRHRITKTEVRPGARRERPGLGSGREELLAGRGGCTAGLGGWVAGSSEEAGSLAKARGLGL